MGRRAIRNGQEEQKVAEQLAAEVEHGNCEYKLQLATTSSERERRLTSQMKWRLAEGNGEAVYMIGVEDGGRPAGLNGADLRKSLDTLRRMAKALDCRIVDTQVLRGLERNSKVAKVTIRAKPAEKTPPEVRAVVLGDCEAGKTSLIGVLKTGDPDDGNGLARLHVLQHQHELDQGHTSSVSCHPLRFAADGSVNLDVMNDGSPASVFTDWAQGDAGTAPCVRVVDLMDVAGNPRFIKSAFRALTAMQPDFALVAVAGPVLAELVASGLPADPTAARDRVPVTASMVRACQALGLPFGMVITKRDLVPNVTDNALEEAVRALVQALAAPGSDPLAQVEVVTTSSVSLQGVDQLRAFIGTLQPATRDAAAAPSMYVRKAFYIPGFDGAIIGGIPLSGTLRVKDRLKLGPDEAGRFCSVIVESIRTAAGKNVSSVAAGNTATMGVRLDPAGESWPGAGATDAGSGGDSSCVSLSSGEEDQASVSTQQEFFRRVVRRGTCLLGDAAETTSARRCVWLRLGEWLQFAPVAAPAPDFDRQGGKSFEFVVRCRTVKQRATLKAVADAGLLEVELAERSELFLPGSPVLLQHGSFASVCAVAPEP